MAEKRYQIFVSSTYTDLKEERSKLLTAILKLNFIPAGMEIFPAMDEEQMQFIERVIDGSDYYVLLLGARYGSMDSKGISYTEREYDYAVKQGKKVIALIHANPDKIERDKTDKDERLYKKFMKFRKKVMTGRIVEQWENHEQLVSRFQSSLIQTIQRFPAIGWMRGDTLASTEMLHKIATLELENQRLKEQIKNIGGMQVVTDLRMEACSVTAPTFFSEKEIECIALNIILDGKYNGNEKIDIDYYEKKAIPWFCYMAKICCFDLRITNTNPCILRNIEAEEYFFDSDGNEIPQTIENNQILGPPTSLINAINKKINILSKASLFQTSLNPHRSTMYTHGRYFKVDHDFDITYKRIIFAENIPEPIQKEIIIHYKIKDIHIEVSGLIALIRVLEFRNKFNDAGVYEYITSALKKLQEDITKCNTK